MSAAPERPAAGRADDGGGGADTSSDTAVGRKRRVRRHRRAIVLATLVALVIALAAACDPAPGTGRIRLSGAVVGTDWDGTVGCFGPGHIPASDDYGSWEWDGEVDGQPVEVLIANYLLWYRARLTIGSDTYWAGLPFEDDGSRFTIAEGVGRWRATMSDSTSPPSTVDVVLTFTCPEA